MLLIAIVVGAFNGLVRKAYGAQCRRGSRLPCPPA
jgi:hypothetical protein